MTFTRGVRTAHFTLSADGGVAAVHGVSSLPGDVGRPATTGSRVATFITVALVVALSALTLAAITQVRRR